MVNARSLVRSKLISAVSVRVRLLHSFLLYFYNSIKTSLSDATYALETHDVTTSGVRKRRRTPVHETAYVLSVTLYIANINVAGADELNSQVDYNALKSR